MEISEAMVEAAAKAISEQVSIVEDYARGGLAWVRLAEEWRETYRAQARAALAAAPAPSEQVVEAGEGRLAGESEGAFLMRRSMEADELRERAEEAERERDEAVKLLKGLSEWDVMNTDDPHADGPSYWKPLIDAFLARSALTEGEG